MVDAPSEPRSTPTPKVRALSDKAIKNAKPRAKPYKIFDHGGRGLFLFITPTGSKLWRMKYRFAGRWKLLALGIYPEVSLKDARDKALEARAELAKGNDPSAQKQALKRAAKAAEDNTFQHVAEEWLKKFSARWDESYREKVRIRLDTQVFPWLGKHPISEITAPELLRALRRIEDRGALELAHRVRQHCSAVFRYAIATGRADRDPAADLKGALPPPVVKHNASLTTPAAVGELLRAMDGFQGSFPVACALRLAPLVFVRPGELRRAEWTEIDFDSAEWRIPAAKMKMREAHIVPLSRQALSLLRDLQPLTGDGRYLFPSIRTRSRPMSENTINVALRRIGYGKEQMTGHGFRAMASTLLNELGYPPDVIERQLAHAERNKVRAAYNRAEYLSERREMMQHWADYLDRLAKGENVIDFPSGRVA